MTFLEHIKKCAAKVKTWPKWKREIMTPKPIFCNHDWMIGRIDNRYRTCRKCHKQEFNWKEINHIK